MTKCIVYKGGYKYQLKQEYVVMIPIRPGSAISSEYVSLESTGRLTIKKGYAWDGPSGPTCDTPSFMRGSLIHDALYQLMRDGLLDHNVYRTVADSILRDVCIEDGMWSVRAWWVYQGVRLFADFAADPADRRPVVHALKGCADN